MVVLAVEVLGGLAVLLVHLYCPAVDGLELFLIFLSIFDLDLVVSIGMANGFSIFD